MKNIFNSFNKWKLIILGLAVLSVIGVGVLGSQSGDNLLPVAKANYGSVVVSNKATNAIRAFCKESPDFDICTQKDYAASLVAQTYQKLKNDVPDFGSKTAITTIRIMTFDEVSSMCGGKPADGCWNHKDIGYVWDNFTYDPADSYQLIAHEMLHAYATGLGFNVYPLEEGLVDNLALRLPSIKLTGNVPIDETGTWSYIEMRDVADKIVDIYKAKGKGTSQNQIMIGILKGGYNGLKNVLGNVELTTTLHLDENLAKTSNTVRCYTTEQQPKERLAIDELNDRTYCLYNDEQNFKQYYQSTLDLLEKVKNGLVQQADNSGSKTNPQAGFTVAAFPEILKEEQKMDIKYSVTQEPKVNSVFVAITKPNPTLSYSKNLICRLIKTPEAMTASNGFYGIQYRACAGGNCQDTFSYTLPKTEIATNYKIKIISLTTSDTGGPQNCEEANIIDLKEQELSVEKVSNNSGSGDTNEYGTIKGKIRVQAPQSINQGDAVMVNISMKEHQNDEFMLWITDCDGSLVPKILMSDHQARTIPNNDFVYHYVWDTKAAQTKSCKHHVQVKTFTKNSSNKWVWNDMAKYEITVGANKVGSKLVCIMQLETLTVKGGTISSSGTGNEDTDNSYKNQDNDSGNIDTEKNALESSQSPTTMDGNTDTENNTTYNDNGSMTVNGNKVTLNWNAICGAQKYIVYRDDQYVGDTASTTFTDTVENEGTYSYRVDAYLDGSVDPTAQYNDGVTNDQNDMMSLRNFFRSVGQTIFIQKAKAAAAPPKAVATKKVTAVVNPGGVRVQNKGNVTGTNNTNGNNCGTGIPLGLPIPVHDPNGGFYLKYCAASMADYMQSIYSVLIVIAVISALIMVIYGGYMYITSSGNPQRIASAKEIIIGALVGMALLLSAGLIISSIGIR